MIHLVFLKGKALYMVGLLVLATFILRMLFTFLTKQATSMKGSSILRLSIQLLFPQS
jgi:hypothetical protein